MKEKVQKSIDEFYKVRDEYRIKIALETNWKRKIQLQIPNFLTMCRPLSLLAILPIAFLGQFGIALGLTGLAALTDFFDGKFARKYNAYSEYGQKLDPICDKIFAIGLSLPILITQPFLVLPTILLECLIASIAIASELKQNRPQSTKLGKAKTWVLGIELVSFYLVPTLATFNITIPLPALYSLMAITNSMQIATSIEYTMIDHQKDKQKNNLQELKKDIQHSNDTLDQQDIKRKDIQQEIEEYQHLKETLLEPEEKEKTKTIGTL